MNLEEILRRAGEQPAPPPDPSFVRRLGARLSHTVVVAPRAPRRWLPAAAALAAAAVTAVVVLSMRGHEPANRVLTEPHPNVTTTTIEGITTTSSTSLLPPPPSTTSTTSTTEVRRATTTTTVALPEPTTTSTTAPPQQDLHLSCTSDPGASTITCRWDASTNPRFASYRLVRHTGDGPENVVYTGTDTTTTTSSLKGARWFYVVTALAGDGTVVGRSEAPAITCC